MCDDWTSPLFVITIENRTSLFQCKNTPFRSCLCCRLASFSALISQIYLQRLFCSCSDTVFNGSVFSSPTRFVSVVLALSSKLSLLVSVFSILYSRSVLLGLFFSVLSSRLIFWLSRAPKRMDNAPHKQNCHNRTFRFVPFCPMKTALPRAVR
jgi:hypothetical protein